MAQVQLGAFMRLQHLAVGILAGALVIAAPAAAQNTDVRGKWSVQADGRTCTIDLTGDSMFGAFRASSFGCSGDLFSVNRYNIRGSQIVLLGIGDKELAVLNARGDELTGRTTSGSSVYMRRAGAPPIVASQPFGGWGSGANGGRNCITYGSQNRCATSFEMQTPAAGSYVQTLTNLNVRRGASLSQPVIGTLGPNACLRVNECRNTSEGVWCEVERNGELGYIVKFFKPPNGQSELMTFANSCR